MLPEASSRKQCIVKGQCTFEVVDLIETSWSCELPFDEIRQLWIPVLTLFSILGSIRVREFVRFRALDVALRGMCIWQELHPSQDLLLSTREELSTV